MSDETSAEIRRFIVAKFPSIELQDDQDIFQLGFVNSLFAMELVMFIEKAFAVRIPNEELKLDAFRSVNSMEALVVRLRSGVPAAAG